MRQGTTVMEEVFRASQAFEVCHKVSQFCFLNYIRGGGYLKWNGFYVTCKKAVLKVLKYCHLRENIDADAEIH